MWYGSLMSYLDRTDYFMASLGLREVYRVGGAVRDELLNRRCKDADYVVRGVTLSAVAFALELPDIHVKVTPLKLRNGRQVGWRAAGKGLGLIEIALPRTEISTGPGRRDFEIVVDPSLPLTEDAKRRDFTFNALYKRIPDGEIVDPTNTGLYDLQHRLVRTTHPDSFRDDPLRILRALRFVSTLGYDLSAATEAQMREHADAVTGLTDKGVSGTALDELCKILMGADVAKAMRLAAETGVLQVLLPELAPMIGFEQRSRYHDMTTDQHTFKALEVAAHVDAPLRVRMALLFHDSGKPEAAWCDEDGRYHYYKPADDHPAVGGRPELFRDHEDIGADLWLKAAARLNAPRDLRRDVETLIRHHMVAVTGRLKATKVRRGRVKYGDALLRDLFMHRMCDVAAKNAKVNHAHLARVADMERLRAEAEAAGVPKSPKDLEINGNDLKELGARGETIGRVLRSVLDEAVCDPDGAKLTREWQLQRAKALL